MTRTAATLLLGAGFMLAFAPSACTPNEDAGECDSNRPCSSRGEVCDTLEKVCIEADVDVDATADPPATGNFGPLALPFFRGKVCIASKAKPGDVIPVSISPCIHPCITNLGFHKKNTWRCVGTSCEGLNFGWIDAQGTSCPADVFGRFDASMCTYDLTIDASQGAFSPSGMPVGGIVTTEVPFISNEDSARVDAGASNDELWAMVNAYPADDERIFEINLSDSNPSAPANCVDDPSLCDCFDIGF